MLGPSLRLGEVSDKALSTRRDQTTTRGPDDETTRADHYNDEEKKANARSKQSDPSTVSPSNEESLAYRLLGSLVFQTPTAMITIN
jgi:hypothetical protein